MPIAVTPEGWVKVPPRKVKTKATAQDLRGTLAYFAGRMEPPRPKPPKMLALPAPPAPPKAQPEKHSRPKRTQRIVSEPTRPRKPPTEIYEEEVEVFVDEEEEDRSMRSASPPRHRHSSHRSRRDERRDYHDYDHNYDRHRSSYRDVPSHPIVIYQSGPPHHPGGSHSRHHNMYSHREGSKSTRALSYNWYSATRPLDL